MTRAFVCLIACCGLVVAGEPLPFQQSAEELKIFELTNLERKKKDAPLLKLNPLLSKVARAHSANMARQGKFDHTLDGKDINDRVRESGYKSNLRGENIAFGEKGAAVANIVKSWMESKEHSENLLHVDFVEMGVGIARDKDGDIYYTQVFARPKK